jgi:high-affinity Fe2+/Pb2+ permease
MDKKRKHKMEMNAKARRKARHKKSSKWGLFLVSFLCGPGVRQNE